MHVSILFCAHAISIVYGENIQLLKSGMTEKGALAVFWRDIRITENRRLAIAAAAIRQRITNLRRPLEFFPVLPLKKGSAVVTVIVAGVERMLSI